MKEAWARVPRAKWILFLVVSVVAIGGGATAVAKFWESLRSSDAINVIHDIPIATSQPDESNDYGNISNTLSKLPSISARSDIEARFAGNSVSVLKQLLNSDPKNVAAAKAIAVVAQPGMALEVIQEFIRTYTYHESAQGLLSKIGCIRHLSYIDWDYSGSLLRNIITEEGANDFLSNWKGKNLPHPLQFEDIRYHLRYYAARALAGMCDESSRHFLTEYFALLQTRTLDSEDYRLYMSSPLILALNDLVCEIGLDNALKNCTSDIRTEYSVLRPYMQKYMD